MKYEMDVIKKNKLQEKKIEELKMISGDYKMDLIVEQEKRKKIESEYKKTLKLYEIEKKLLTEDEEKITNAIKRLNALIIFWKKYNPIDNIMQIEQFKEVIEILEGVKQ